MVGRAFYTTKRTSGRKKFNRLNCFIIMAYDKDELFKKAMDTIDEQDCLFISDILGWLAISSQTYYHYFPNGSQESNSLKEKLWGNRIRMKNVMRRKWYESDNATLQMGLMKMISSEHEAERLNGTKQKIEHSGDVTISPKQWID